MATVLNIVPTKMNRKTDTYGERLRASLEQSKYSVNQLAIHLGITRGAVYQVLDGSTAALSAINHMIACRAMNVNPMWLAVGEGQMKLSARQVITDLRVKQFENGGLVDTESVIQFPIFDSKAFALRNPDEKNYPRMMRNELLIVSPSIEAAIEDDVLVMTADALHIGRLVSQRAGVTTLSYWVHSEPPLTFDTTDVLRLNPIYGVDRFQDRG